MKIQFGDAIIAIEAGFACSKSKHVSNGVVHLRPFNIGLDMQIELKEVYHIPEREAPAGKVGLSGGDLLFNNTNSADLVGKVAYVHSDLSAGFSNHLTRIKCDGTKLEPQFAAAYLHHIWRQGYFRQNCTRWVGQAAFNSKALRDLEIPLPPLPEQRRIVDILNRANGIRRLRREAQEKARQLIPALFIDMFGDPATNQKGFPGYTLRDVCEKITDGTHHSPPLQFDGMPYITAKHVKPYGIEFDIDRTFVSEEDHKAIYGRCDPKPGDVLYIKDGVTTGIAAVNKFGFEFSMLSSVALLRPAADQCLSEYLCAWLNDSIVKRRMLSRMDGAAIRRLTLKKIKEADILLPPLPLQRAFAERVADIQALIAQQDRMVEQAEALTASLMARVFNG